MFLNLRLKYLKDTYERVHFLSKAVGCRSATLLKMNSLTDIFLKYFNRRFTGLLLGKSSFTEAAVFLEYLQ